MKNLNNKNYMQDIYDVIYAPEENYYDDGIEYLDEPEDELFGDYDELAWADDITYLDEPEDEEFDLDLGEGFIPLPQGEVYQEELIVIDENYILDEYEEDLVENYERPAIVEDYDYTQENYYSMDDIYSILDETDEIKFDFDDADSLIKFPVQQELEEELKVVSMSEEDDKLAKAIAKEHIENVKASDVAGGLFGDVENPEDDTSWVDGDDIFGNDISVIIAEDPNNEIIDEDYEEGSFQDWLDQQNR